MDGFLMVEFFNNALYEWLNLTYVTVLLLKLKFTILQFVLLLLLAYNFFN